MTETTVPPVTGRPTKPTPLQTLTQIDLDGIQDLAGARRAIGLLFNLVEDLQATVRELQAENQRLRDENNRLKGEQGKPDIKANKPPNHQLPAIIRRKPNGISRRPGTRAQSVTASSSTVKRLSPWIVPVCPPMPSSRGTKTLWCKTCGSRRTTSCSTKRSTTQPAPARRTWRRCRRATAASSGPASKPWRWSSTMPAMWPSPNCWTFSATSAC